MTPLPFDTLAAARDALLRRDISAEELVRQGHEVTLFASGDSSTRAELVAVRDRASRLDPGCTDQLAGHFVLLERVAREAGRFDVGYHLLAAALHAAEELQSAEMLTAVLELSQKRQKAVDSFQPNHRLSTHAATRRGNTAQYTALAAIATSVRGRIAADLAVQRGHRSMRKGG